jgi:hypothetical protein
MSRIMNRYSAVAALLCAAAVAACDKYEVQTITMPEVPGAKVRFFNFGVGAPSMNFYANSTKLTATGSSSCSPTPTDTMQQRICRETGVEATTGVSYGAASVASTGLYSALTPGDYTLKGTIAATTDHDLAVASLATTLQTDTYYSYYVSGVYNTTAKTVEAFIVEDPIPPFDYSVAKVRFVNAISNSNAMALIAKNTVTPFADTPIGGDVPYTNAGIFVDVAPGIYDLRTTGTTANLPTRAAVTFSAGRVYTITARGDITVNVAGTGTTRPILDNTVNR